MLKTAFIGCRNPFTCLICEWLAEHTDLSLIIWANEMWWAYGRGWGRVRRIAANFLKRARKRGWLRAADEFLCLVLYRTFIYWGDANNIDRAMAAVTCHPRKALGEIKQVRSNDIRSPELLELVRSMKLDAMFSMCIDVYMPADLIQSPKYGSFLWHEGITPEYRGVHSPFWALVRKDYDRVGYTLLRMNSRLDAGEVFVQGRVRDVDMMRDWHGYLGPKAVLDSLPAVAQFIQELEAGRAAPISRDSAVDGYYSYPTGSGLLRIAARRFLHRLFPGITCRWATEPANSTSLPKP